MRAWPLGGLLFLLCAAWPGLSLAAGTLPGPGLDALTVTTAPGGGQAFNLSVPVLALLAGITLLPAVLLGMTSFTRILIVLALLRQALGTGQIPSTQILIALALFLSFFVMTPTLERVASEAVRPYLDGQMTLAVAVEKAALPAREFMLAQVRTHDLETFAEIAHRGPFAQPADIPFTVLAPAFLTSELKTGFQIGFLVFLPFLIIDLVVASVLMSMGMMMLSPSVISLPFKLMLFVLVDGWTLLIGTLAGSFTV
jgi:flagellar biosynthetic protein FliP